MLTAWSAAVAAQPAGESAVYVHDSGVAVEKLALADKLERLKEWDKSGDVYLEVATDFADRVIAVDGNERQYVSAPASVRQRLAKWPAEGVAAFRARFEPAAAAALESAGHDPAALRQIINRYCLTDAARQAGLTLIDDLLERGAFADALTESRQLLDQSPQLSADDQAALLFRVGVAAHQIGPAGADQEALAALSRDHGSAIGQINGKDVLLKDALSAVLAEPATRPSIADGRWLTAAGDAQRNRIVGAVQFGGARMGFRDIEASAPRGTGPQQLRAWQRQFEAERTRGFCTGIFPVIDRGELFFQDNARLYAINLDSGDPLPGWAASYPETAGVYNLGDAWPVPPGQPCTLTLSDDSVFATMGLMDYTAAQYVGMFSAHSSHLVCLDRRSGQPRWTFFSQQLPENLTNLDFAGCPLVDGANVYVQAHGTRGQFDDAYLLAFDRTDGSFRWSCYLCSANVPNPDIDPSASPVPTATALALDGESLIVQTNNGAMARIDPATPSITWLSEYPRDSLSLDRADFAGLMARRAQQIGARRPWEHNYPIVSGGKIFCLPDDSPAVLVYNAADGSLLKRILLSDYDLARSLLGVSGDNVIIHSGKRVFCVDWTKYPSNVQPVAAIGNDPPARAKDALVWMTNELKRAGQPDDAIRGRGAISADSVIIPTAWQLWRFSLAGGSLKSTFPALPNNQWADDEGPGNLLFAGDQLIVAGTTGGGALRVSWYTDLQQALRRLDSAVAAAPTHFEPRLRYAQALFTAGEVPEAARKFDEAIERAPAASTEPAAKAKLYAAAVEFGRRAGGDPHGDPKVAEGFFDRAADYITSPEQQVDFRLIRADFERDQKRPGAQVALYQQILSEPKWRSVNVLRGDENSTAAAIATEYINNVGAGGEAYAPIDQAAQSAFTKAVAAQNVAALAEVAAAYPNSSVVGKALTAAGEQSQFAGAFRQSTDFFRRALSATNDNEERRRLLTRMAQCYVQLPGGMETAAGRLRQAARLSAGGRMNDGLTLPDGKTIAAAPFADAAAAVHAVAGSNSPPLPDCAVPPNRLSSAEPHAKLTNPFTVVDLSADAGPFQSLLDCVDGYTRNDRLVAQSAAGVAVFKPGAATPLFRVAGVRHVLHAAWIGGSLALIEPRMVTFVTGENGETQWQISLGDIPASTRLVVAENLPPALRDENAENVASDFQPNFVRPQRFRRIRRLNAMMAIDDPADATEQFRLAAPLQDRLICATTTGRVIALALSDGKPLWQSRVSDRGVVRLLASDDFVVAQSIDPTAPINILSTLRGDTIQRGRIGDRRFGGGIVNAALSTDGMLVTLGETLLSGKDLFEPGKLAQPTYQFPALAQPPTGPPPTFTDPSSPVISERLIFTLSDGGTHLRVFSLDDGKPVAFNQTQAIDTGTRGNALELAADGGRCYVACENWVKGYDIAHQVVWGDLNTPQIREIALTQSHVMALADPPTTPAVKRGQRHSELQLYSRTADQNGAESGWLEYRYALPQGFVPTDFQPVDGGVYLLGSERKLIFLAGQRAATH